MNFNPNVAMKTVNKKKHLYQGINNAAGKNSVAKISGQHFYLSETRRETAFKKAV